MIADERETCTFDHILPPSTSLDLIFVCWQAELYSVVDEADVLYVDKTTFDKIILKFGSSHRSFQLIRRPVNGDHEYFEIEY